MPIGDTLRLARERDAEVAKHRRALARLRCAPAHRRTVDWSLRMLTHLLAIERVTGRWESY